MSKNDLRIDILGTSFSIVADENPEYMENLLNRYRHVIENTQKSTNLKDPLKIAIIAGFLLCDELEKSKKETLQKGGLTEHDSREAEKLTMDLIARLDEALGE